ncbi:MAG: CAP domain-containing protein [Patescibacteria group bacterium]
MRKFWVTITAVVGLLAAMAAPALAKTYYSFNYRWVRGTTGYRLVRTHNAVPQSSMPTVPQPRPPAPPAQPARPADDAATQNLTADESYILQAVNAERAKAGLAPLQIDYRLVQTARTKSRDMIQNGYFGHQSPTLGSPFDQMRAAGITYRTAGENIAGNSSVAGAMQAWMNSPGHRANILNAGFTRIGIGVIDGGPYGKMLTQHFMG